MRRIYILLFLATILSPAAWTQETAQQQLYDGYRLEKAGAFDATIRTIEPIVAATTLTQNEVGNAWTLLGYAYREMGEYQKSQSAYERAVQIFADDSGHRPDYANALDCFAGLYRSTGRGEEARSMWSRALNAYGQLNDHRGMAKVYANLAGLALEEKNLRSAQKAIAKALAEARMAKNFMNDDYAILAEVQAWIASAKGDDASALVGYQRVVNLRKQSHGENFPLTGWSYLILGRAYLANRDTEQALASMREGLDILEHTGGRQTPRYLAGEVLYSQALELSGSHEEAARMKSSAQESLKELYHSQCLGCTVSASSFR